MRCGTAHGLMIAAADGELSGWRRRSLARHLAGCEACRAEERATTRLLAAVAGLPSDAAMPARLEQAVLRLVRHEAAAAAERRAGAPWLWPGISVVATGALAAVVVLSLRGADVPTRAPAPAAVARQAAPAPKGVAIARRHAVPQDPPPALAAEPGLFVDMAIVRQLDKLQHFDAIAGMDADDGGEPSGQEAPSNG
jgi:anti-sigma factor RsiW